MKKTAMTIAYIVGDNLYLNITNSCPCHCVFCIRNNGDNAYDSDPLWLEHMPSLMEIKKAIGAYDLSKFKEIVFCGFGEPTSRFDTMIDVCDYLHTLPNCPKIRLNTNGLTDLMTRKNTPELLKGKVDIVSVSLNAGDAETYGRVTRPNYDSKTAYDAVIKYILDCKKHIPEVTTSLVDIISEEEIAKAKEKADELGVPLRVRKYEH
jgi:radical SAM enzyme (TIGR04100 family)